MSKDEKQKKSSRITDCGGIKPFKPLPPPKSDSKDKAPKKK